MIRMSLRRLLFPREYGNLKLLTNQSVHNTTDSVKKEIVSPLSWIVDSGTEFRMLMMQLCDLAGEELK